MNAPAASLLPKIVTFYSRYNGTRCQMPNKKDEPPGKILEFFGGKYETSDPAEIAFLNEIIDRASGTIVISKVPVQMKRNDAVILKDVSNTNNSFSSQTISSLAHQSNTQ